MYKIKKNSIRLSICVVRMRILTIFFWNEINSDLTELLNIISIQNLYQKNRIRKKRMYYLLF